MKKKPALKKKPSPKKKPAPKKTAAAKRPPMILLPEKNGPLVHLELALMNGSLRDPQGKEGTASLALSMLLRGTKKKDSQAFHRTLDNIGGEFHLGKYKESQRIYGVCLADKLPEFLDLLEEMLVEPAFDEAEFTKVRDQLRSGLLDELGSDDEIADRRFQEYMLWGNSYGRMTSGSLESLERISVEDLRAFHKEFFRGADFIVGASGGFDKKKLETRMAQILDRLPEGTAGRIEGNAPVFKSGKSLLLLDKPARTQAQLYIGAPGISFTDKDYFAMLVANHVFGGSSFSARLMREVREKRGWSYGCYSWYRSGKQPLYFGMHAVPSNKDAIPALKLMLQLFQNYGKTGITKEEFQFAKKSLVSQSAFLQDTLRKRLDNKVTEAVLGLKKGYYDQYQKRLSRLTYSDVQKAIRKHVDPSRIFAVVLGSVDQLELAKHGSKGFSKVWKKKFDEPAGDLRAADPYIVAGRGNSSKAESPVLL
ncbi:MAG: M16 family metallopeptidase [Bdellovibrionota bacterium]